MQRRITTDDLRYLRRWFQERNDLDRRFRERYLRTLFYYWTPAWEEWEESEC